MVVKKKEIRSPSEIKVKVYEAWRVREKAERKYDREMKKLNEEYIISARRYLPKPIYELQMAVASYIEKRLPEGTFCFRVRKELMNQQTMHEAVKKYDLDWREVVKIYDYTDGMYFILDHMLCHPYYEGSYLKTWILLTDDEIEALKQGIIPNRLIKGEEA